jgi:aldehyde dehydrogenase (NAD+)
LRGIVFGAAGTAGQRCTTTRRLIVHESVHDELVARLKRAYASLTVGDPRSAGTLVGPLIDRRAFDSMQHALEQARSEGGQVHGGERQLAERWPDAYYVRPALVTMPAQTPVVCEETFAPILYVMTYRDFDQALQLQNGVAQGLSSAIFTNDLREAEAFVSARGSTAASPTSTSAPPAPRSAARSAARRRPAAAASRGRIPGARTCGVPPTRSTTRAACRWRRA